MCNRISVPNSINWSCRQCATELVYIDIWKYLNNSPWPSMDPALSWNDVHLSGSWVPIFPTKCSLLHQLIVQPLSCDSSSTSRTEEGGGRHPPLDFHSQLLFESSILNFTFSRGSICRKFCSLYQYFGVDFWVQHSQFLTLWFFIYADAPRLIWCFSRAHLLPTSLGLQ